MEGQCSSVSVCLCASLMVLLSLNIVTISISPSPTVLSARGLIACSSAGSSSSSLPRTSPPIPMLIGVPSRYRMFLYNVPFFQSAVSLAPSSWVIPIALDPPVSPSSSVLSLVARVLTTARSEGYRLGGCLLLIIHGRAGVPSDHFDQMPLS